MSQPAAVAVLGLGVMGQNLALNLADHGYRVAVFNRRTTVTEQFVRGEAGQADIVAATTLEELVEALDRPRRILMMITAGAAVDTVARDLAPLLDPGDIIIDGGNSLYTDTRRRVDEYGSIGIRFVGAGISGGEVGARNGPSIMPGGDSGAWPDIKEMLQAIAATVPDGTPCCDWVGPDGAGHYVKMVHNGIEYGDMQVIAEAYHLMRDGLGLTNEQMGEIFSDWGTGVLDSYLIDITGRILAEEQGAVLDSILDAAGQKGTGKWTVISSMELGQPTTLVAEAVYARIVSAFKEERVNASKLLRGPDRTIVDDDGFVDAIHDALYASKIVSYAQGFLQLAAASTEYGWDLDLGRIAQLWREGCIIRARFLDDITAAFHRDPELLNLLLDEFFREAVDNAQSGWRRVVSTAVEVGIPVPAYATALGFYDSIRSDRLPANLIQAQRDFFGAHTYERIDRPRGEFFHHHWEG